MEEFEWTAPIASDCSRISSGDVAQLTVANHRYFLCIPLSPSAILHYLYVFVLRAMFWFMRMALALPVPPWSACFSMNFTTKDPRTHGTISNVEYRLAAPDKTISNYLVTLLGTAIGSGDARSDKQEARNVGACLAGKKLHGEEVRELLSLCHPTSQELGGDAPPTKKDLCLDPNGLGMAYILRSVCCTFPLH